MRCFLASLAGILLAGSLSLDAAVISGFGAGDQGWRSVSLAFPDPGAPPSILNTFTPNWQAAGGNPGGYISNIDPNPNVQYWLAPAQFLGNQSAAYLNSLLFSLAASPVGTPFTQADIILTGGGLTLTNQLPTAPTGNWTDYTISLSAGSWKVNSPAGTTASAAQLQTVLGSLTGLYIRGEFYLSNDVQSLDSVQLQTGSVPEPATLLGLLSGLGVMILRRTKLRRR